MCGYSVGFSRKETLKTVGSRVNTRFEHLFLAFENYCVRVNTDRPIPQQPSCNSGTLVSGNIKIMQVFAKKRLQTTVGSRVMRASVALHAEVYALCA